MGEFTPKNIIFCLGGNISISTFSLLGSDLTACVEIILPKNGTNVHLKWYLSLFSFRFTCLYICSIFYSVSLLSSPLLSYPSTKMSPVVPNTFGKSLNISSFLLNSPQLGLLQTTMSCVCTCQIEMQKSCEV